MSSWSSSVQILDIMRTIHSRSKALFKAAYKGRPKDHLALNDQSCRGVDDWDDLAITLAWEEPPMESPLDKLFAKGGDLEKISKWNIGLSGIFKLIHAFKEGRFSITDKAARSLQRSTMLVLGDILNTSTQLGPKRFKAQWEAQTKFIRDEAEKWEAAVEGFKHMRNAFTPMDESEDPEKFDQELFFGNGKRVWYGWIDKDVLVMKGAQEYVNQGIILIRPHLDLLIEAMARITNILFYVAKSYHSDPETGRKLMKDLYATVDTAGKVTTQNVPKVCRAYHKARGLAQWMILENVNREAVALEVKEYGAEGLDVIVDQNAHISRSKEYPTTAVLDFLNLYKWIPPPDYDATSAFPLLKSWHFNHRKSGLDFDATNEEKELYERIRDERKMNFATAYKNMTGEWPADLEMSGTTPKMNEIREWCPGVALPYYTLGKDIAGQVKDKVTVENTREKEKKKGVNDASRSFLLWYLEESEGVDTVLDAKDYSTGSFPEENYVRVAYKPEPHKPDSRLFFMAPPRQRILLGELEGNLSRVAEHYPGSLQGKNTQDKSRMVHSALDPVVPPHGVDPGDEYEIFIVTFDLSKFSPKSNPAVIQDYHAFWSAIYGSPAIRALGRIGCESTILHTTGGMISEYRNPGCDLEGFRGRMMTMFHADMLATACRIAKEKGYILGKGQLCVFIDDGSVKIAAAGSGEVAEQNVKNFLATMREVYHAAGQDNNPAKTCISRIGGEILAEFYMHAERVPAPIKAAMRMNPDYDTIVGSINEDFDSMFATAQGACKDGGDWISIWWLLADAYIRNIGRWVRNIDKTIDPTKLAFKIITPKSYGGFGFPPLQALVTTAGINMTAEGLGLLNRAARAQKQYRLIIRRIVTRPIVVRNNLSILRDPHRVRTATPVIVENRLTMKVVKWLSEGRLAGTQYMRAYQSEDLIAHAISVADAILGGRSFNVPLIERVWKSTPLHFVENLIGKFKRSATIIRFIGYRKVNEIRKQNMKDLLAMLRVD